MSSLIKKHAEMPGPTLSKTLSLSPIHIKQTSEDTVVIHSVTILAKKTK